MKICEQHGQTNCSCIPPQNKITGNKSDLSEVLDGLADEMLEAARMYVNKGNSENTYANGQNDGRSLAYIDCANRIKLLMKKAD
ncbi:hypothetical protein KAR91_83910 [Candidatus Pacearchaeota archaeon]|nr:hypothetical protein [Candidatus Pacearchaeota archaeon]